MLGSVLFPIWKEDIFHPQITRIEIQLSKRNLRNLRMKDNDFKDNSFNF